MLFRIIPRYTTALLLCLLLLGILLFNIRLYYQPSYNSLHHNQNLLHQLEHLKEELHNGAADDMQRLYPEGYVFLTSLYGLTWIEVAEWLSADEALFYEANIEINWVLAELASPQAKRPFHEFIAPSYGIFYRGWSNYVLGRKIKALRVQACDSAEVQRFRDNCAEIVAALRASKSPFLESYADMSWPADMTVGMASVAIHEELFPNTYQADIQSWLTQIAALTDTLGLIPHASDPVTGAALEPARGSSQSLILSFLYEIDSAYAKPHFERYKEVFLNRRLGLPGIREYPRGYQGEQDIDSGPVIWGIGGAASIVGQRTMTLYGERQTAIGLRNSIESFGVGKTSAGKKAYLFGALAMADAFIAWSNSTEAHSSERLGGPAQVWWFIHLLSLVLMALGGWAVWRLLKKK